jgi:vacuolar-type H+-ATPase subunit I/STV1
MKLPTGSFVVSHKGGVDTIAVRKRLCPHGADTPLIEPKPFTADLSRALGGLQEEIAKAIAAKKEEESSVKRLEHQVQDLKKQNEQLQEKANIKLSVKEMMEAGARPQVAGSEPARAPDMKKLEERVVFLESVKKDLEKRVNDAGEELKLYDELKSVLRRVLNVQNIYDNVHKVEELAKSRPEVSEKSPSSTEVGLQHVKKIMSVEEARLIVPTIRTDTVKGKILALAQNSFFDNWQSVGDINAKLVDDFRFNASDQAINGALKELVDEQILGMKHTDRNRWKLSPDVVFEGKKEASS